MARFDFGAGFLQSVGEFDPLAVDKIAAFPSSEFEATVMLENERGGRAGLNLVVCADLNALVAARKVSGRLGPGGRKANTGAGSG